MTTYKNSFPTGPREYSTDKKPESYNGFLIYPRFEEGVNGTVYDIVQDGVCISQSAGPNRARKAIDSFNSEKRAF